ncbi:MAG: hypothetical protein M1136_08875 [Chloroflexi bacterium]|nr:hypothetical protein [Chloroflexota bacterium]
MVSEYAIIWASTEAGGRQDIYGWDLRTNKLFRVTETGTPNKWYSVHGNLLIWMDDRVLRGFDLSRKAGITLPLAIPGSAYRPVISADAIAWTSFPFPCAKVGYCGVDIDAYDRQRGVAFSVAKNVTEASSLFASGKTIVWADGTGYHYGTSPIFGNVWAFNIDSRSTLQVTNQRTAMKPAIWENIIVWQDDRDSTPEGFYSNNTKIYGYDLETRREFPISTSPGRKISPAIYGPLVVWQDNRIGNWDIYGYDLRTKMEFLIAIGPTNQIDPRISGNLVVWIDGGTVVQPPSGGAVWAARISLPLDWDVSNGHFYTQANGFPPGTSHKGYAISDANDILFWAEFQRLGGVDSLGYPASRRFIWDGFTSQAMQKQVFQWRPEVKQVYFVNVFDELSKVGKDDWLLAYRQVPKPFDWSADAGLPWSEIVQRHLKLLDSNPAIKARYLADPDPIAHFGLPMAYGEYENVFVLRGQRAVLQQWRVDTPWAKAGQVTVANGGDILKEAGLIPREAIVPESPPQ